MYHATREDEVDDLLRDGALVDLYRVVRQGVRISKPSYSLKKVEDFYWTSATPTVKEAGGSIVAYERWIDQGEDEALEEIERLQPRGLRTRRCGCATGCSSCARS